MNRPAANTLRTIILNRPYNLFLSFLFHLSSPPLTLSLSYTIPSVGSRAKPRSNVLSE